MLYTQEGQYLANDPKTGPVLLFGVTLVPLDLKGAGSVIRNRVCNLAFPEAKLLPNAFRCLRCVPAPTDSSSTLYPNHQSTR